MSSAALIMSPAVLIMSPAVLIRIDNRIVGCRSKRRYLMERSQEIEFQNACERTDHRELLDFDRFWQNTPMSSIRNPTTSGFPCIARISHVRFAPSGPHKYAKTCQSIAGPQIQ